MMQTEDQPDFENLNPDEKLRAENELLKLKLQAEFGMDSFDSTRPNEIENDWLKPIPEFEKQDSGLKKIKVYDFVGRPEYKSLQALGKTEIGSELARLLAILMANNICLDDRCDYTEDVTYRYVTEILFNEEIDDIRIPEIFLQFHFEEYYPDLENYLKRKTEEFFLRLFSGEWSGGITRTTLATEVEIHGLIRHQLLIEPLIREFQQSYPSVRLLDREVYSITYNKETEKAEVTGFMRYQIPGLGSFFEGNFQIGFAAEHGYLLICKVEIPEFEKLMNVSRK